MYRIQTWPTHPPTPHKEETRNCASFRSRSQSARRSFFFSSSFFLASFFASLDRNKMTWPSGFATPFPTLLPNASPPHPVFFSSLSLSLKMQAQKRRDAEVINQTCKPPRPMLSRHWTPQHLHFTRTLLPSPLRTLSLYHAYTTTNTLLLVNKFLSPPHTNIHIRNQSILAT